MNRAALRREAGPRSLERGEICFKTGKVRSLAGHEGTLAAKVQGTRSYRVKLFMARGGSAATAIVRSDRAASFVNIAWPPAWPGCKRSLDGPRERNPPDPRARLWKMSAPGSTHRTRMLS